MDGGRLTPPRTEQQPTPASITADPRLDQVLLELVRRRYNQAQLNEALALFQAAYRLYPDTRLLYNMALIFERQERTEQALKHSRRFVKRARACLRSCASARVSTSNA